MQFIDTHSHIYLEQFDEDRDTAISRAIENGVTKILLPNVDASTMEAMLETEEQYPNICHAMAGVHPCSIKDDYEKELEIVEKELERRKYIAIGEIGLDLYWDKSTLEIQKTAFKYQLELAIKYNIPVVIHVRDSFNETFEVLESMSALPKGVFHCFSGSYEISQRALKLGFMLGIGGVVTFKNTNLRDTLARVPIENVMLETDAPYLTPHPYRGKRNESSYISIIAKQLTEVYNISIEEVAEQTTKNALQLFKL